MRPALLTSLIPLALVTTLTTSAHAEPPRPDPPRAAVHLVYSQLPGPEACSDETGLRLAVRKELGYDPFVDEAPLRLTVNLGRSDGELFAEMDLRNEIGAVLWSSKSVRTRSCASFLRALGLVIAIAIERRPGPSPCPVCPPAPVCPEPVECPAPQTVPVSGPAPKSDKPPSGPIFLIGAAPLVAVRMPLAVAPAAAIFGSVRWSSISLTVEGRAVFPGSKDYQQIDFQPYLFTGSIAPCGHLRALFGCGLLGVGSWYVAGPDVSPGHRTAFSASVGLRTGVEQPLGERLYLRGYIDALGTIAPLLLRHHPRDWVVPNVAGVAGLGLLVRL